MLLTFTATSSPAINAGLPLLLGGGGGCRLSQADLDAIAAAVWAEILSGSSAADRLVGMATAILAAAQAAPIHADMRKVRGQDIDGAGTEADPWGPA